MQHQLDVVTKMMTFLMDGKKDASDGSMEQVRPGTTSLATLVEPADTAPIDFADWLTVIEPAMQDLSDSSYAWWEKVMTEATTWYQDYVKLRPLQRSMFEASPSSELRNRVERRAVTMMMSAVPASIKDELVATKSLSPLKIITKLMTIYQPGGLQEKSVILKQLEDPGEAAGTSAAVAQLRKWLRWMRRAEDVNLSLPDASILMRGLTPDEEGAHAPPRVQLQGLLGSQHAAAGHDPEPHHCEDLRRAPLGGAGADGSLGEEDEAVSGGCDGPS